MPRNCKEFIRDDDNKAELFSFLSLKTVTLETEKQIIITHHKDILCTQPRNTTGLAQLIQGFSCMSQMLPIIAIVK